MTQKQFETINIFRKIDYVFFNEEKIRQAVYEARNFHRKPEIPNKNSKGDPTAQEAVKNLTPIKDVIIADKVLSAPELWLDVIDKTRNRCIRRGGRFPEVFQRYYSGEHFANTCFDLELPVNRFYRTLDKIRAYASLWAAWHHLIFID